MSRVVFSWVWFLLLIFKPSRVTHWSFKSFFPCFSASLLLLFVPKSPIEGCCASPQTHGADYGSTPFPARLCTCPHSCSHLVLCKPPLFNVCAPQISKWNVLWHPPPRLDWPSSSCKNPEQSSWLTVSELSAFLSPSLPLSFPPTVVIS